MLDVIPVVATHAHGSPPAAAILDFLCNHSGRHAKADILAATGITDCQWNAAIADLLANGQTERRGEGRGARYRAIQSHRGFGGRV